MVVKIVISVAAGIMSGWGAVIFFNKIPPSWLCDYGESPSHKLWAIRIDKYPWAPIFSLAFMIMMYIMCFMYMNYLAEFPMIIMITPLILFVYRQLYIGLMSIQ